MLASGADRASLIGALSLRTSGVQFIMITLAFAQMLFFLFVSLKAYGGDDGLIVRRRNVLPFSNMRDDTTFYYVPSRDRYSLLRAHGAARSFALRACPRWHPPERAPHGSSRHFRVSLQAGRLCHCRRWARACRRPDGQLLRFVSPDMLHWTKSGELMIMVISAAPVHCSARCSALRAGRARDLPGLPDRALADSLSGQFLS